MATMNVSLPDLMKEWVDERVKSGQYGNASEYVRDLIREDQRDEELRRQLIRELEESEEDIRQGRYIELRSDEEIEQFFDDIIQRAIDESAQGHKKGKRTSR